MTHRMIVNKRWGKNLFKPLMAWLAGSLFALGLLISGMANSQKVLNFLDLAGPWDASLAFVMLGAIAVGFFAFSYVKRHAVSLLNEAISLPSRQTIDGKLIAGSLLFGMGWGMAGICPAPALTLIGLGYGKVWYFVVPMLAGMWGYRSFSGALR